VRDCSYVRARWRAFVLPHRVYANSQTVATVATFTPNRNIGPAEAWELLMRPTPQSSDGAQGIPLGSLRSALWPGHGLEHESVCQSERIAIDVAQTAAEEAGRQDVDPRNTPTPGHLEPSQEIRTALRASF
jgi:hypothetical protein